MNNPYSAYKQQSVMTMTAAEMLLMLYDGLLKELNLGLAAFETKDYGEINRAFQKSQKIVNYLAATLDFKYEIAKNLEALYDYFNHTLVEANVKKDPTHISDVISMVSEIRDAYAQAAKSVKIEEAGR